MTNFQAAVRKYANQSTTQGRGASVQHVLDMMRNEGWRNLGNAYFFEGELLSAGFKLYKDAQYLRNGKPQGRKFVCVTAS